MSKILGYAAGAVFVAGAVYGGYRITKSKYAATIAEARAGRSKEKLMQADYGYLRGWAKAIKSTSPTFVFKGKVYATQTGSAV